MSIVTLFTKTAPTIAGVSFDAVLEDTFEATVDFTSYPIEAGAQVVDHGILKPFEWSLTGLVSNNPLRPVFTDFTGVLSGAFGDSGALGSFSGLAAGFLAGSNDSRGSSALSQLLSLMATRQPFDIDAGDISLTNMVITNIYRVKDPSNEQGLEFTAQLQELPTLETVLSETRPLQSQLRDGDPVKTQAAAIVDKGEQILQDIGDSINTAVKEVLAL